MMQSVAEEEGGGGHTVECKGVCLKQKANNGIEGNVARAVSLMASATG